MARWTSKQTIPPGLWSLDNGHPSWGCSCERWKSQQPQSVLQGRKMWKIAADLCIATSGFWQACAGGLGPRHNLRYRHRNMIWTWTQFVLQPQQRDLGPWHNLCYRHIKVILDPDTVCVTDIHQSDLGPRQQTHQSNLAPGTFHVLKFVTTMPLDPSHFHFSVLASVEIHNHCFLLGTDMHNFICQCIKFVGIFSPFTFFSFFPK